ncbi:MAG: rRNA pseudouridine synthase [Lachnospiraceae bacterium]|nr:rRNA pseudouridine synthase [Lachnospiraceae bacterium]
MRLDKFLSDMKCATRSQLKKDIRAGLVTVNGEMVRQSDFAVDENKDKVGYKGTIYEYEKFVYYMLNKPAGVVSATEDKKDKTVVDLLKDIGRDDLFPMGRLDKDTEGLLILTNDGALTHELLSPTKHVEKVYECTLAEPFDVTQKEKLEQGVDIGEKKLTMPAKVAILEEKKIALTILEGKFHQVKRMLQAVGNEVIYLKRVRMGGLVLDERLQPGEYRKLTSEEVKLLQEKK